ncbi:MAG: TolC family protein [Bacteroidota bacterium]|nr:TolC family protein [Bacteroidota bacterium]MDP4251379.1 TolC family protein [Bacteroidota bacterium]
MKRLLLIFLLLSSIASKGQELTLDYFINHAKTSSPLLADYRNQIQSGRIDSQLVKASYKVQVNGISNNYYAPDVNGFGYDNIITNGGQVSAQVQASKSLISKGNLAARYQAVHLQNETLGNNSVLAEKDLKKTITGQYISVYGDLVTLNFNREILALFEKEEKILKKLTQANIYKQTDYLTFYVSLQQQQLTVRQSEIQYKNDCATLNYLSGIVDTSSVILAAPGLQLGKLPEIYNSSFYRQYTLDSLRLLNDKKTIDYTYKPRVNVFADAGYNSSLMYDFYKNFGAGFGVTLSVPIYDGKQQTLKHEKISLAERTRQQYRGFFLDQYNQQIAQLMQQLTATESLIHDIEGQIKYSGTLVDVNQKLLETGEVRITDLILAINNFLAARNLLNQNAISQMQIINQINYWEAI